MEKNKIILIDKRNLIIYVSNSLFIGAILLGIYISIKMNINNRSLWMDEAMLSYSFSKRGIWGLLSSKFEYVQSAPAGWLYLVKVLTIIWGNTEFILRISSVLAYMSTLIFLFPIAKKGMKSMFPLAMVAFVAFIPIFVKYSNVFKPYEFDAMCTVIVLYLFMKYEEKTLNYSTVFVVCGLLVWFSNPVCFIIGGCISCEILFSAFEKNKQIIKEQFIIGSVVVSNFFLHYFLWSSKSSQDLRNCWGEDTNFSLILKNKSDIKKLFNQINVIFSQYEKISISIMILFSAGCVIGIINKNRNVIRIIFGIGVTIFASTIGFYPVVDRFLVYLYPIIAITALYGAENIISYLFCKNNNNFKMKIVNMIVIYSMYLILLYYNQGWRYLYTFNLWWNFQELNTEIEYIENNIKEGDAVYISANAMPGYQYKMGYDNHSIGGFDNNVYYALNEKSLDPSCIKDEEKMKKEIDYIKELDNCYIVLCHYNSDDVGDYLMKKMSKYGDIKLVSNEHLTPLYYFSLKNN